MLDEVFGPPHGGGGRWGWGVGVVASRCTMRLHDRAEDDF